MKYKKLYNSLLDKVQGIEYEFEQAQREIKKLEGKIEGMEGAYRRLEGRESYVLTENQWLRDTLRLVIVPEGKEIELAKLTREEQKRYQL